MKYKRKNITLQESIKILREWECAVKRGHWSKDNHELADAIYIVLNTLESLMEIEIDKCNEKADDYFDPWELVNNYPYNSDDYLPNCCDCENAYDERECNEDCSIKK